MTSPAEIGANTLRAAHSGEVTWALALVSDLEQVERGLALRVSAWALNETARNAGFQPDANSQAILVKLVDGEKMSEDRLRKCIDDVWGVAGGKHNYHYALSGLLGVALALGDGKDITGGMTHTLAAMIGTGPHHFDISGSGETLLTALVARYLEVRSTA